ncbi:MAG: VWA domain-containing protein [Bryobacteraceae bacterium]
MLHRLLIAALIATALLHARQHTAEPARNTVFSVSTTLVQVDAVVTDRKGRQVTTLKPKDFSVRLDGKPRQITNFSYINLSSADVNEGAITQSTIGGTPARIVRPQDVHRSMVLLVDDLGLSFTSMAYVRRTLHHFIEDQMRPGDLVALWETGHMNSVFQQFTSDKRVLEAAVDSLRWNPYGTGLLDAFTSLPPSPDAGRPIPGQPPEIEGPSQMKMMIGQRDEKQYLETSLSIGTLGVLNH